MRIGVFGNPEYRGLPDVVERLGRRAEALGVELAYGSDTAPLAGADARVLTESWDELDVLLTLGGDGTLLQAARLAGPRGIPVVGCNLGRLGFLTAAPLEELEGMLERLVAGDFREERRLALDITVRRGGGGGDEGFYALNDAVIHKSGFARLITLRVWVDDEEVGQYSADGIVLATATGSTAYSLSAGGPVLVPSLDAIVATPISPHTLAVRPVVVPSDSRVVVEVRPRSQETILTVDGQSGVELEAGDRVEATPSEAPVRLVQFPDQSFFSVLRRKLRWGDVEARER